MRSTLILTVGGSPEPLAKHLAAEPWDRVVFVCSEDDPASGKPGSHTQVAALVEGAGLAAEGYRTLLVPADDPSVIHERCLALVRAERADGARVTVDYTGGTKSMSAMLALAGLGEGAEVTAVLGPRSDQHKVRSGTEQVVVTDTSGFESRWALDVAARAWSRFDYAAAADALDGLRRPTPEAQRARALSHGYARWAAFDYAGARTLLEPFGRYVPALPALSSLAGEPNRRNDAARVDDLWLASERHARAARFDVAVLLIYRANEAIAQWSLRWDHGIDPGDVPADSPIAELASQNHAGKRVLGQHVAWQALGQLGGPLAEVARATARSRLDLAQRRNGSILAHGTTPLTAEDHARVRDWFAEAVSPAFVAAAFRKGARAPQLPDALPA